MNTTLKRYLESSLLTFLSTFFLTIGIQLGSGGPIEWSTTWIFALLMLGARAGTKAVYEAVLK